MAVNFMLDQMSLMLARCIAVEDRGSLPTSGHIEQYTADERLQGCYLHNKARKWWTQQERAETNAGTHHFVLISLPTSGAAHNQILDTFRALHEAL